MRLLIVELTRLRWRRAVIVLTALAILLPALIWAGLAWDTRPISEEERRQGIEMMEQDQQWQEEALTECVAHPEQHFDPQDPPAAEEVEQACRDMFGHGSDMTPEMYVGRQALTLDNAAEVGIGVMVLVLGLARHVRRGGLVVGLDEQPAAVRTTARPGLGRQGGRGRDRRRGPCARGPRHVLGAVRGPDRGAGRVHDRRRVAGHR
jgi:hypothetical protein